MREEIRTRDWFKTTIAVLTLLLTAFTAVSIARTREQSKTQAKIDAMYQKALYETCELTESLAVNYAKLIVAGTGAQSLALLGEISRQSQGALSNLAMLPLGEDTVSATMKFVNQAGDFAETLSQKLAAEQSIAEADYDTMRAISESASAFSESMNGLMARYAEGEDIFSEENLHARDDSLAPLTGAANEYPALLYDGAFADVERGTAFRTLENRHVVSREEAQTKVSAYVGGEYAIAYEGESDLPIRCYEFTADMGEYGISVGVTQQGGEILYMLSDADISEAVLSEAEGIRLAENFLTERGYGSMESNYTAQYGGILTVNFASVENDILYYPDLIKVQVDMRAGRVIGLEAAGYLQNHVPREWDAPSVTEDKAIANLSPNLHAQSVRLCVIPQNMREYLCYEVTATSSVGAFLVYVDAFSGEEREILQIVDNEAGALVM